MRVWSGPGRATARRSPNESSQRVARARGRANASPPLVRRHTHAWDVCALLGRRAVGSSSDQPTTTSSSKRREQKRLGQPTRHTQRKNDTKRYADVARKVKYKFCRYNLPLYYIFQADIFSCMKSAGTWPTSRAEKNENHHHHEETVFLCRCCRCCRWCCKLCGEFRQSAGSISSSAGPLDQSATRDRTSPGARVASCPAYW